MNRPPYYQGSAALFIHPHKSPFIFPPQAQGAGGVLLPQVGPFLDLGAVHASSLSNITYSFSQAVTSSRAVPLKYNTITINNGVSLTSNTYGIFIWCNNLILGTSSALAVDGTNGTNGSSLGGGIYQGGTGGSGGSGGGGGAQSDTFCGSGQTHGSGSTNGGNGTDGSGPDFPGSGGQGFGTGFGSTPFPYLTGGENAGTNPASPTGGYGAGGDGGDAPVDCGGGGGGAAGGGAGAGMIIVVANSVSGPANFYARGGTAGLGSGYVQDAWSGGGGTIQLFMKAYDGASLVTLSGGDPVGCNPGGGTGNFLLYVVNHAGTAVTSTTNFMGNSWDNR